MRMKSAISFVFAATMLMLLIAACGSGDSSTEKESKAPAPLDAAAAQLLYEDALARVQVRKNETGEYFYLPEEIELVEQAIKLDPESLDAMEVLAWVYSTYSAYVEDTESHEAALEYALELFKARGDGYDFAYQLLGAAMFANGQLVLGTQFFDRAINGAPNGFLREMFLQDYANNLELHAGQLNPAEGSK